MYTAVREIYTNCDKVGNLQYSITERGLVCVLGIEVENDAARVKITSSFDRCAVGATSTASETCTVLAGCERLFSTYG